MSKFDPRYERPEAGNPYYNTKGNGGYSTAIVGKPTDSGCNVLANCVGYAYGRFNEIAQNKAMTYLQPVNAENFYEVAKKQGLTLSQSPSLGAVMVWQKGATLSSSDGAGHVAIVEHVYTDSMVRTSESGYNAKTPFWTQVRSKGTGNWSQGPGYTFLGFIKNPAVPDDAENPYSMPKRVLSKGDQGDDVKWLQWYLKDKGYLSDAIDGGFGTYTLGALLAYQFEHDLEVDGVCGPATRASLTK